MAKPTRKDSLESAAPGSAAPTPRIYVVDDDRSVRRAIVRFLNTAGIDAASFDSSEAMMRANLPRSHACVILDVYMPGTDGLALQRKLARHPFDLDIIVVTASADPVVHHEAYALGAVAVLAKPFDGEDLLDIIDKSLGPTSNPEIDPGPHLDHPGAIGSRGSGTSKLRTS